MKNLFNSKRIIAAFAAACLIASGILAGAIHSYANQANTWSPTVGQISGLTLTTNYNNAFSAVQSCNSGGSAPTNDQSAAPVQGQCWLNTSTTPFTVEQYDGTQWVTVGWIDTANHQWIANNAGGTGTIPSGTTTDLGTVQNPVVTVTGSTPINSFGSSALVGTTKFLNFTGTPVLTNNAVSLILPNGGANITAAAGDTAIAVATGSGNWRILSYTRASGLGAGSVTASFLASSAIPYGTPCLNCTLRGTVAANALTVAVKTLAGADPSPSDPVSFLVPDANLGYAVVQQTSAISITVPSSATLGTISGQATRIWLGVFNNGGTPALAVYVSLNSSTLNILAWDETGQPSTTAISGTSTSPQTWYTAGSVASSKNFRVIGAVEITEATAGTWASGPSKVFNMGPGVRRPNEEIQTVTANMTTNQAASLTTFSAIPGATVSITPISNASLIRIEAAGSVDNANNNSSAYRLSRGTTAATNLIGGGGTQGPGAKSSISLIAYDIPGGAATYAVQGKSTGSNAQFPDSYNPAGIMVARELQM